MTGDLESAAKEPSSDARAKREMKAKKRAEKMEKQRRLFFRETKDGRHVSTLMNVLRVLFYPIHALLFPFRILPEHAGNLILFVADLESLMGLCNPL